MTILTADIGGTWIKLARFAGTEHLPAASSRLANPCREGRADDFAAELITHCLHNENAVAENWNHQAANLATCAARLADAFKHGGRLIYLGCGTSGRLAALDALELNCTFGLPKKIINAITTSAMILCGKVAGTYMIDVACLNDKLIDRACGILLSLHGLPREAALDLLRQHDMRLSLALQDLREQANDPSTAESFKHLQK